MRFELLLPDLLELILIDCKRLKEALGTVVVFQYIEQLASLVFPARAPGVSQDVALRLLIGGPPGDHVRDAMLDHLAEVALPLASGALLHVAEAISVESPWAVIAADELALLTADATLIGVAIEEAFPRVVARLALVGLLISGVGVHAIFAIGDNLAFSHAA